MSLWSLEWIRLTRTGRVLILLAVFFSFGIIGPLSVKYLPELLEAAGSSEAIGSLPPVTPEFAMSSFLGNALQIGLLAVAFVGAAALAIDTKPEVSVFFRSRATIPEILTPRFVATSAATVVAFAVGVATAAVTSGILIGWPQAGATIIGSLLVALYLVFAVALLALFGSLVRKVPATALLTVGTLIVLSLIGLLGAVGPWLPSYLIGGFDGIIAGGDFVYWRAIVVTVAAIAAALALAVVRLENREV
jgi:ABC-2 type transport system permease protein